MYFIFQGVLLVFYLIQGCYTHRWVCLKMAYTQKIVILIRKMRVHHAGWWFQPKISAAIMDGHSRQDKFGTNRHRHDIEPPAKLQTCEKVNRQHSPYILLKPNTWVCLKSGQLSYPLVVSHSYGSRGPVNNEIWWFSCESWWFSIATWKITTW